MSDELAQIGDLPGPGGFDHPILAAVVDLLELDPGGVLTLGAAAKEAIGDALDALRDDPSMSRAIEAVLAFSHFLEHEKASPRTAGEFKG